MPTSWYMYMYFVALFIYTLIMCYIFYLFLSTLFSYHFSGSIPANVARLQSSLSHYPRLSTGYHVKVLYAFSFDEVAKLVRRLAEWRHNESPVRGERRKREKEERDESIHMHIQMGYLCTYVYHLRLNGMVTEIG